MLDCYHYGSGSGATRKEAVQAAIQSWASFTGFEYGSFWENYAIAASKRMNCLEQSTEWACDTSARPYRPWYRIRPGSDDRHSCSRLLQSRNQSDPLDLAETHVNYRSARRSGGHHIILQLCGVPRTVLR